MDNLIVRAFTGKPFGAHIVRTGVKVWYLKDQDTQVFLHETIRGFEIERIRPDGGGTYTLERGFIPA